MLSLDLFALGLMSSRMGHGQGAAVAFSVHILGMECTPCLDQGGSPVPKSMQIHFFLLEAIRPLLLLSAASQTSWSPPQAQEPAISLMLCMGNS